jgi:CRP-like cAMP-binding protein
MALVGRRFEVMAGDRFLQAGETPEALYLILEGEMALVLPQSNHSVERIATYSSGDVMGVFCLPSDQPLPIAIEVLENSWVLAIARPHLTEKLQQDAEFSARFYRAIAMLLSQKQWQMTSHLPKEFMLQTHLMMTKSILSVFSCLHDSDMCWMTSAGSVKSVRQGDVYIREGQPLSALDIILQGSLCLYIYEGKLNALSLAFNTSPNNQPRRIASALPGEILGVTAFLDMTPNFYMLKANEDARVLSIPISALTPKLQQDTGFAARFYQALASLSAEQMFQIISQLGEGTEYESGDSLSERESCAGEVDSASSLYYATP